MFDIGHVVRAFKRRAEGVTMRTPSLPASLSISLPERDAIKPKFGRGDAAITDVVG